MLFFSINIVVHNKLFSGWKKKLNDIFIKKKDEYSAPSRSGQVFLIVKFVIQFPF